jgi:hypothetical protein
MFSNLILRNSRRSRKENGLFFSSLVISIVAFYMILSISTQDVMLFLQKMESDAVDKLLLLIPAFYGMTLGILFFLIYFACKYQFERRRHELGVYLMLGMRRSKLFGMLLAEDFLTSILAMLIGLPVAVVLSEIVSLVTAKLVGMGIIGHQFSLSWSGNLPPEAYQTVYFYASPTLDKHQAHAVCARTDTCRQNRSKRTEYRGSFHKTQESEAGVCQLRHSPFSAKRASHLEWRWKESCKRQQ